MEKKYFSKLGLMYFLGTICVYAAQILVIMIVQAVAPQLMENYDMSVIVSMLPMYLIGYPIMIALIRRIPVDQAMPEKKKMTVGQWLVAFFMSYSLVYIMGIISNITTTIIGTLKQSAVQNTVLDMTTGMSPALTFVVMVIAAPIMEEYIFRKLLIDRAAKYGEVLAIVLSGTMFGLFHGNLNQFMFTFVMGCFYGFIYTRTRNVIHTILLHMLNNFMSSMLSILVLEKSGMLEIVNAATQEEMVQLVMENLSGAALYYGYVFCLLVIAFAGIILLILKRKKFYVNHTEEELPKGKRFITVTFNVGMLLFIVFHIVQIVRQLFL